MIVITRKPKRVDVPEQDILDSIESIKNWFNSNPERTDAMVGLFGHRAYPIRRDHIEEDVRKSAETATEYEMV